MLFQPVSQTAEPTNSKLFFQWPTTKMFLSPAGGTRAAKKLCEASHTGKCVRVLRTFVRDFLIQQQPEQPLSFLQLSLLLEYAGEAACTGKGLLVGWTKLCPPSVEGAAEKFRCLGRFALYLKHHSQVRHARQCHGMFQAEKFFSRPEDVTAELFSLTQ